MNINPYKALATTVGVHFFIMFALTFVGVYRFEDIFINLNRFYMAVLMVVPMIVLMMIFMRSMFENKKLNYVIYAVSALVFVFTFWAIRAQTFVGNDQFLRSMIPHHSIAIKTCDKANITDKEISELCDEIIAAQEREIDQMRDIMKRMDN